MTDSSVSSVLGNILLWFSLHRNYFWFVLLQTSLLQGPLRSCLLGGRIQSRDRFSRCLFSKAKKALLRHSHGQPLKPLKVSALWVLGCGVVYGFMNIHESGSIFMSSFSAPAVSGVTSRVWNASTHWVFFLLLFPLWSVWKPNMYLDLGWSFRSQSKVFRNTHWHAKICFLNSVKWTGLTNTQVIATHTFDWGWKRPDRHASGLPLIGRESPRKDGQERVWFQQKHQMTLQSSRLGGASGNFRRKPRHKLKN